MAGPVVFAQSTKPPQQPLRLPDPTPRPTDLSRGLPATADPDRDIRQQQNAALRRQNRTQTLSDAATMVELADKLREHAAHPDGLPAPPLDRMAIQKIEQLAKDLRSKMLAP